jgi:hypothetical protein
MIRATKAQERWPLILEAQYNIRAREYTFPGSYNASHDIAKQRTTECREALVVLCVALGCADNPCATTLESLFGIRRWRTSNA